MTIKIREITGENELLSLKEPWKALLAKCDHTVFSTWEWMTTWWKHFGRNKELFLLIAEENGALIGAAPFAYSNLKSHGFPIRKIEFIGTPKSDYNNFVTSRNSETCIRLFLEYAFQFYQKRLDSIELDDVTEPSTLMVVQRTKGHLQTVSNRSLHECFYITLPDSYESLYSQLEYKFRQNLRRSMRNLEKTGKVEFADYSGTNENAVGMQVLFDLHQRRWTNKGDTGAFAEPAVRAFNLDIADQFAQLGWLSLHSLNVNRVPVASAYGFKYNSKFYYYLHGINPDYHRFSVGNLLVVNLLKECIENQFTEFDFLRGDETYKGRWTSSSRKNYNITITKRNFGLREKNWFLRTYSYQVDRLKKNLTH
jgi:CelD/BcsL family acetyltransferase involved in cellulose biosynthesis